MKTKLEKFIEKAAEKAFPEIKIPVFEIETPREKKHGDFSANIAMSLAKELKKSPWEIAQAITQEIPKLDKEKDIEKIEVAGAGFINFFLTDNYLYRTLEKILKQKDRYGKQRPGTGEKVLLEFLSANPTGPLHIGHGRWGVLGDTLANLLEATGNKVEREFYINDVGTQIDLLTQSVKAAIEGKPAPEGGYGGSYIKDIAAQFKDKKDSPNLTQLIMDSILVEQRKVLANLGIKFDHWFSEKTLHEKGKVKKAVEQLKKLGVTFEEGGALWFKSKVFGDDKNRVLIREGGEPTYFATDIAYHDDKFKRGYEQLINIWGTDHHGYVPRLKAALKGLKLPVEKFEIIIGQLVSLFRGKEPVRMSKRTGEMITLSEVVEEIGADATRFFLLMRGPNSHLDFDLELAKKHSLDNPVYYVQYGHARIYSIFKETEERKIKYTRKSNLSLLKDESERHLMQKLAAYPEEVLIAVQTRGLQRLTTYAQELARFFHAFYHICRVISDDPELTQARLVLVDATRIVLKNVLKLLGVSAPERM